jgi:methyl-accepting chemotaxis protein
MKNIISYTIISILFLFSINGYSSGKDEVNLLNKAEVSSSVKSSDLKQIQGTHKLTAEYSKTVLITGGLICIFIFGLLYYFLNRRVKIILRFKIIFATSSLIVSLIGIVIYSFTSIQSIGVEIKNIADHHIPLVKVVSQITEHHLEQRVIFEKVLRESNPNDIKLFISLGHKVDELIQVSQKVSGHWTANAITEDEKKVAISIDEKLKKIKEIHNSFEPNCEKIFSMRNKGEAYKTALNICTNDSKILGEEILDTLHLIEDETEEATLLCEQHELDSESILFAGGFIAILFGLLTFLITIKDTSSLILESLSISKVLTELSNSVLNSSTESRESSNTLATMTEEQAAGLQEMVSTVEELSAMIKKNAEHSELSSEKTKLCKSISQNGQGSISEVALAIKDISMASDQMQEQIGESNNQIMDISEIILNISKKTEVINLIDVQS